MSFPRTSDQGLTWTYETPKTHPPEQLSQKITAINLFGRKVKIMQRKIFFFAKKGPLPMQIPHVGGRGGIYFMLPGRVRTTMST